MKKLYQLILALALLRNFDGFAQVATPSSLNTALGITVQGNIASLGGVDPLLCPPISMSQTWDGGKLIFSDSPESPATNGMLYIDTNLTATAASITNRIFVYHVNSNSAAAMRFSVLIKNNGASSGTLTVTKSGIAGPSTAYAFAGEICFLRWLTNTTTSTVTVAAGQTVRLDSNFDTINVSLNNLLHGIWDYTFTQPHTVMICSLKTTDNPITVGPTLGVYPRDGHVRGTFANCNKIYNTASLTKINTSSGIQQFTIAASPDTYVTGFDNAVASPSPETDSGNYGVLYKTSLASISGDGRALALLVNPRGGAWSGAIKTDVGLLPGGAFLVPNNSGTLSDNTMGVIAGEYFPGSGGTNIIYQFMPTGGVSFPVRMLAVPFNAIYPALASIASYQVNPGQTVNFTAAGSDANTNKTISYALTSAPASASINSSNGQFNWRPPVSSAASTNTLQVQVADGSTPPLTASRTFTVKVNALGTVTLTPLAASPSQFQLRVAGIVGPDYILEANTALNNPAGWTTLKTNTPTASPFIFTDFAAGSFSNRFYRVRLAP